MDVSSAVPDLPVEGVVTMLAGLPEPGDYSVHVRPLRYRDRPPPRGLDGLRGSLHHVAAAGAVLPVRRDRALRRQAEEQQEGTRPRFIWLTEGITFRTPEEVLRFSYCHEWMHWWLKEVQGPPPRPRPRATTSLHNFRRRAVTEDDALRSLKRR